MAHYSDDQINQYLDYISFPVEERAFAYDGPPEERLKFLKKLMHYQLAKVPFENLAIHYSADHTVTVDADYLFDKIVTKQNGRGGYCMEINTFFAAILRGLKFDVTSAGGRVSNVIKQGRSNIDLSNLEFGSLSHMVNIVAIGSEKYSVDCAFGNNGPTLPIPLQDGFTSQNTGDSSGGTQLCLKREHLPNTIHRTDDQLLWIYNIRYGPTQPWVPCYCFGELEFHPNDFRAMNYFTSTSPTSIFTQKVVCMRFLIDKDTAAVLGDLTLFETVVKERKYEKSTVLVELKSEQERVEALKKYFDIDLSEAERNGINGTASMIK
ncbi:putative N-acetyltransferase family protein [Xylogone sp. PMI_703]|nr:putative N-acetyltransferase family protein [Xylogone sp. PMI_703]